MMAIRTGILAIGCSLSLIACANVPPPDQQLAVSQAAVEKAKTADAYEWAPVEFGSAQEKLTAARAAMEAENYTAARRLAEAAEVEADLAYFKARSSQSQKVVQELQESIDALRRELEAGG